MRSLQNLSKHLTNLLKVQYLPLFSVLVSYRKNRIALLFLAPSARDLWNLFYRSFETKICNPWTLLRFLRVNSRFHISQDILRPILQTSYQWIILHFHGSKSQGLLISRMELASYSYGFETHRLYTRLQQHPAWNGINSRTIPSYRSSTVRSISGQFILRDQFLESRRFTVGPVVHTLYFLWVDTTGS